MLNTELVHWLKLRGILIASLYVSMWGKIKLKQEIYILVLVRIWQYPPMIILRGGKRMFHKPQRLNLTLKFYFLPVTECKSHSSATELRFNIINGAR